MVQARGDPLQLDMGQLQPGNGKAQILESATWSKMTSHWLFLSYSGNCLSIYRNSTRSTISDPHVRSTP